LAFNHSNVRGEYDDTHSILGRATIDQSGHIWQLSKGISRRACSNPSCIDGGWSSQEVVHQSLHIECIVSQDFVWTSGIVVRTRYEWRSSFQGLSAAVDPPVAVPPVFPDSESLRLFTRSYIQDTASVKILFSIRCLVERTRYV
jgi:hypothetical protein